MINIEGKKKHAPLHHYTKITFLLHLLSRRKVTLVNPLNWPDKNEVSTFEAYMKKEHVTSIYALSLTSAKETAHHWNSFASGIDGCRISFRKDSLEKYVRENNSLKLEKIRYINRGGLKRALNSEEITSRSYPFIKRDLFRHEEEYRLIFSDSKTQNKLNHLEIDLDIISSITINAIMDREVFESIKRILKIVSNNTSIQIRQSNLLEDCHWGKLFKYETR